MKSDPPEYKIEHESSDNTYTVVKWMGSATMRVRCYFAPPYKNREAAEAHLLLMEILETIECKQEDEKAKELGQTYGSALLALREHLQEVRDSWK